jgi:hypothetical protein
VKRRLVLAVAGALLLLVLELGLGGALAAREPLVAVLRGELWVALLAVAALASRLALLFVAPPWVVYALALGVLGRRARKGAAASSDGALD